jgi:hypothetical protein
MATGDPWVWVMLPSGLVIPIHVPDDVQDSDTHESDDALAHVGVYV